MGIGGLKLTLFNLTDLYDKKRMLNKKFNKNLYLTDERYKAKFKS